MINKATFSGVLALSALLFVGTSARASEESELTFGRSLASMTLGAVSGAAGVSLLKTATEKVSGVTAGIATICCLPMLAYLYLQRTKFTKKIGVQYIALGSFSAAASSILCLTKLLN